MDGHDEANSCFQPFCELAENGKGRNKHTSEKKEMSKVRSKAINNE
jgi:hypothetical protein